jgi:pilus assembly protein CpaF
LATKESISGDLMSVTHPAVRRTHDGAGAHDELVERLDQQVRELVRREGVDPQREAALVRRIAEGVVREHDDRSLTGVVAPVPDVGVMVGELVARVSGFGPLQPFLDDDSVEEVWINDPSRVFIARNGRHELTTLVLTSAQVQELVERMLKSSGRRIDVSSPFVDAMLPEGHRLLYRYRIGDMNGGRPHAAPRRRLPTYLR